MTNQILKKNILTSYLISVPTGLLTVLIVFMFPVMLTGEGLATILLIETYGWAIVGLIASFLIAIWIGTIKAHNDLTKEKRLLKASFNFSLTINLIIWITFMVLTIIDNIDYNILFVLVLPIIGFIVSVIGTTFTIGLLVTYIFDKNIKREKIKNTAANST